MGTQRERLNLKAGDRAYFIADWLGRTDVVTITGECDEGGGYTAVSPAFAAEHGGDGAVHTCNGFVAKTRREARGESLRVLRLRRRELAEQQAAASRTIAYIDHVISRGGRH